MIVKNAIKTTKFGTHAMGFFIFHDFLSEFFKKSLDRDGNCSNDKDLIFCDSLVFLKR